MTTVFKMVNKSLLIIFSLFFLAAHTDKNNLIYNGFTASYEVSKNSLLLGVSDRQLIRHSETQYTYKSLTYATGIASWFVKDKITELSHYQLLNEKIQPTHYEYKNSNGKANDNFNIVFDNIKNTATRSKDNIKHTVTNNTQDALSFQIAVMLAVQRKHKGVKFTLVDNESIHEYSLNQIKSGKLETENGNLQTIVLEAKSNNSKDRYVFWCAEKYNFLPVKIQRIEPNGDELLIQLKRINNQKIIFTEPYNEDEDN
ncbi:hypothetical protein MNBD_GAMMA22-2734 [hydrothermal vent metagenome]|uniref:DUF3108 domain-containing protein n=1 Tax=hydrothermal vent metagenome TaxID=652676 RepID=A0A3B0ZTQ9_9ZZZZ